MGKKDQVASNVWIAKESDGKRFPDKIRALHATEIFLHQSR